jgi:opacity protein-like surface antigen
MKSVLKLTIVALVLASLCNTKVTAQAFAPGNIIFSAGYGAPNLSSTLYRAFDTYDDFTVNGIGPVHAKVEYAVAEHFGIGLAVNYSGTKVTFTDGSYNYALKYNPISFNLRGNIHIGSNDKFDPYIGIGLGYGSRKWTLDGNDPNIQELRDDISQLNFPVGLEGTLGARYFISDNLGVYLELGPAKSLVQAGISFKIAGDSR